MRPGWQCLEGGIWHYALGGVTRTAKEWAIVLASAKPTGGKARSTLDAAMTSECAGATSNSPLADRMPAGGALERDHGAAGDEVGSFKWGVAVEVCGKMACHLAWGQHGGSKLFTTLLACVAGHVRRGGGARLLGPR